MAKQPKEPTEEPKEELKEEPQEETKEEPKEQPEEPKEEAVEAPASEVEEPAEPEQPAPEEPQKAKKPTRAQLRIQQLLEERRNLKERLQTYQEPKVDKLDYRQALDADDEVINRFEQDRQAYGQAVYQDVTAAREVDNFKNGLRLEEYLVGQQYDFMNTKSPKFDPVRTDAMNRLYLQTVGYQRGADGRESVANPHIRYSEFVDAQMEFAESLVAEQSARSSQNIAKQAATTGIRPGGSVSKKLDLTKNPKDMTDDELNAAVKKLMPKS